MAYLPNAVAAFQLIEVAPGEGQFLFRAQQQVAGIDVGLGTGPVTIKCDQGLAQQVLGQLKL